MNYRTLHLRKTDLEKMKKISDARDIPGPIRQRAYFSYLDLFDDIQRRLFSDGDEKPWKVIGLSDDGVITLAPTDNPFGIFWTQTAIGMLSAQFGLGELFGRAMEEDC